MKAGLIRLVVAGMMIAGMSAMAADNAAAPKHARAEWKGVVSAPATNAAAGVLAVLTVKQGETFNLTATDDAVAATIKAEVAKGATVVVHGELKDKTAIAVTKCVEPKKDSDKPAKK